MPGEPNYEGTVRYIPCANCGSSNVANAATCARCGMPLGAPTAPLPRPNTPQGGQMECQKCHKTFPAGAKFCGFCGKPLSPLPTAVAPPPLPLAVAPQPVAPPASPRAASPAFAPGASQLFPATAGAAWEPPTCFSGGGSFSARPACAASPTAGDQAACSRTDAAGSNRLGSKPGFHDAGFLARRKLGI